jgi:hypothetical protein
MKKIGNYSVSDDAPKEGDRVICIQKTNFNYGKIETVTKIQAERGIVDRANWKVIVDDSAITAQDLREFKETYEVTYAHKFGNGINKKLVLTLSGGYKVYNNDEVILENMSAIDALNTYNLL